MWDAANEKKIVEEVLKNLIVSLAFAAVSVATCMGQCQGDRLTVSQELHDAGAAIVGTVYAAAPVPDSSFHMDGVNYVVHIDRLLKGRIVSTDQVNIFSENSPTKFPMQVGKQYVLFVHRNYNTYEVDNCGNSGLLQASNIENIRQLREYAKK